MPDDPKREVADHERESGATSGLAHGKVVESTIGRERALRNAVAGGPPPAPASPDAAGVEHGGVVAERGLKRGRRRGA